MKLRNNLVSERKIKNLTQVQISELFGITEQHYQRIEAGTSDGSVKLWQRLSKFFKKSIDYLLEQIEDD